MSSAKFSQTGLFCSSIYVLSKKLPVVSIFPPSQRAIQLLISSFTNFFAEKKQTVEIIFFFFHDIFDRPKAFKSRFRSARSTCSPEMSGLHGRQSGSNLY